MYLHVGFKKKTEAGTEIHIMMKFDDGIET